MTLVLPALFLSIYLYVLICVTDISHPTVFTVQAEELVLYIPMVKHGGEGHHVVRYTMWTTDQVHGAMWTADACNKRYRRCHNDRYTQW